MGCVATRGGLRLQWDVNRARIALLKPPKRRVPVASLLPRARPWLQVAEDVSAAAPACSLSTLLCVRQNTRRARTLLQLPRHSVDEHRCAQQR